MTINNNQYFVIKDTREQKGWDFVPSKNCAGMEIGKLDTGDYTIKGFETQLVIERKGTLSEFCTNLFEPRFTKELERLESFAHPFVILEFDMKAILEWPFSSLSPIVTKKSRISNYLLLKRFNEVQINYKTKFILAGGYGKDVAASIFKRMVEQC